MFDHFAMDVYFTIDWNEEGGEGLYTIWILAVFFGNMKTSLKF